MSTTTLEPNVLENETTAPRKEKEKNKENLNKGEVLAAQKQESSTLDSWLKMDRDKLDEIYEKSKPGTIPLGDTRGTVILAGGLLPKMFSSLARFVAWQGKVIDLYPPKYDTGVLVNKISPFGFKLIVAKIYRDTSWMDGKQTIVIDYSKTSLFARQIRDEIREVEPGLYLGKVWWGKQRILDFALETHERHAL